MSCHKPLSQLCRLILAGSSFLLECEELDAPLAPVCQIGQPHQSDRSLGLVLHLQMPGVSDDEEDSPSGLKSLTLPLKHLSDVDGSSAPGSVAHPL